MSGFVIFWILWFTAGAVVFSILVRQKNKSGEKFVWDIGAFLGLLVVVMIPPIGLWVMWINNQPYHGCGE